MTLDCGGGFCEGRGLGKKGKDELDSFPREPGDRRLEMPHNALIQTSQVISVPTPRFRATWRTLDGVLVLRIQIQFEESIVLVAIVVGIAQKAPGCALAGVDVVGDAAVDFVAQFVAEFSRPVLESTWFGPFGTH